MTDSRHPLSSPPAPEATPNAYGDVRRLLPQLPGRTAALLLTGLVGACSVPAEPGEPQPGSGEPIAVPEYGLPEPEPAVGSGSGASVGEGSQRRGPQGSSMVPVDLQVGEGSGAGEAPAPSDNPQPGDGAQPVKPGEVRRQPPAPVYGLPPGNVPPDPVPRHPPPVQPYGVPIPPPEDPIAPVPVQPYGVPIPPPEQPLIPPPTQPGGGLGDLPPLPPVEGSGADAGTMLPSTGAYGAPPALRSPRP